MSTQQPGVGFGVVYERLVVAAVDLDRVGVNVAGLAGDGCTVIDVLGCEASVRPRPVWRGRWVVSDVSGGAVDGLGTADPGRRYAEDFVLGDSLEQQCAGGRAGHFPRYPCASNGSGFHSRQITDGRPQHCKRRRC